MKMRACVIALCLTTLAACSGLHEEASLGSAVSEPRFFQDADPADAMPAMPPFGVVARDTAAAPQRLKGAEPGQVAELLQPPGGTDPFFLQSNAYVERRTLPRNQVKLKGYAPGTIVVKTHERRLYFVLSDGQAVRYPVGVGKEGQRWTGSSHINSKRISPPWAPPDVVKRDSPQLPDVIPGGSPSNPLGVAALVIDGGEYAIHGTNRPSTIGHFVSYGCIRMYNEDIMDLYERVQVGTKVVVER